jgi:hypothetical protein
LHCAYTIYCDLCDSTYLRAGNRDSNEKFPCALPGRVRANIYPLLVILQRRDTAVMRDLDNFKRLLGEKAKGYTTAQLEELCREMYGIADILLTLYLEQDCPAVDKARVSARMDKQRSINKLPLG